MTILGLMKSETFEQHDRWLVFRTWYVRSKAELLDLVPKIKTEKARWNLKIEFDKVTYGLLPAE